MAITLFDTPPTEPVNPVEFDKSGNPATIDTPINICKHATSAAK